MTRRQRDAGLSLVEVLVVLALVAVMSSVTVLGLGALDRGSSGEAEAMRLADRLRLAADEALVAAAPLALVWDERGYRFLAWNPADARWRPSMPRDLGRRHALPAPLRLSREGRDDGPVTIAPDLPQPPSFLRIAGGGATWRVAFDGINAAVAEVPN
jgi:general secretion pathway protein H